MAEVLLSMGDGESKPDSEEGKLLSAQIKAGPEEGCPEAAYGVEESEFVPDWDVVLEAYCRTLPE